MLTLCCVLKQSVKEQAGDARMPRHFGVPSNDDEPQAGFYRRIFNAVAYSLVAVALAIATVAALCSCLVLLKVLAP